MALDCLHAEGPGHDCNWVDWRNSWLEQAERYADATCGSRPDNPDRQDEWSLAWDRAFLTAMDRLSSQAVTVHA